MRKYTLFILGIFISVGIFGCGAKLDQGKPPLSPTPVVEKIVVTQPPAAKAPTPVVERIVVTQPPAGGTAAWAIGNLDNDNWQESLNKIKYKPFELLHSKVTLMGVVADVRDSDTDNYCLTVDRKVISNDAELLNTTLVFDTSDDLERYSYVRVEGILERYVEWSNAPWVCQMNSDSSMEEFPYVKVTSVELLERSDVLPPLIKSSPDSLISQHGIKINLQDIHVTRDEIRIYLKVINDWEVDFVPGFGGHSQLRIEYNDNIVPGLGAKTSEMYEPYHNFLSFDCELVEKKQCLEFSAGTEQNIMYLFKDPLASAIVDGDINTVKVIFESEEGYTPYKRGVRDFIWELDMDSDREISVNILTEDLSDLPILRVTIDEIKDSYEGNRFTFESNYKGRKFEIEGEIESIDRDWITELPVIRLGLGLIEKGRREAIFKYNDTIECHFPDSRQIMSLSKGDRVTFVGTYVDGDLKLINCFVSE